MAASANLQPGDDPFINAPPHGHPVPHRYASFDNQLFSLYSSQSSPSQAKRALEAHLKDTDRRIQDASRLGTTLVQQRKDLAARLKEVEQQKDDGEIGPELQKKLTDLEKEYTEVGRESARAFLPKSRLVSNDFADVTKSPQVFSGDSRASPSKVSAPSRRARNQPTNRVHDIEFATEISTSLLAQVRQLQAFLSEKEELLKDTSAEKAQLEVDIAGLRQRLRSLDESEQRYKDENWNLETQLQEVTASLKEATDREQRLILTLKSTHAEKEAAQRELEDLKAAHGKLAEDHETWKKQQDSELHGLRRDVAGHESEKDALQRKIEELTSQNTELARAVAYRWNSGDHDGDRDLSIADEDLMADQTTPEHSPPPSPTKTPARHGMLESETLKSSLHHAHRMIQNLKNNIHREKTEKIELKRMLQDARDELESRRGDGMSVAKKRRSEPDGVKFRKPLRPDRLGASRNSQQEIILDEEDWEDHNGELSPSRAATFRQSSASTSTITGDSYGHAAFDEPSSTDAFETANERDATETEAFQTGVEDHGGDSSDELTETESNVRRVTSRATRPSPYATGRPSDRMSYQSTASTSADEYDDVRTPVQAQQPKYKLKVGRNRRSARDHEFFASSVANDSPASMSSSTRGTPVPVGQSLGDELDALSDDDDDSTVGTPSRVSLDSARSSPEAVRESIESKESPKLAAKVLTTEDRLRDRSVFGTAQATVQAEKATMVDSGMMTEPWEPQSHSVVATAAGVVGSAFAGLAGYALGKNDVHDEGAPGSVVTATSQEPGQVEQMFENSAEPKTLADAEVATPIKEAALRANMSTPRVPLQQSAEPTGLPTTTASPTREISNESPVFGMAPVMATHTEPRSPPRAAVLEPARLGTSNFTIAETEPISPPRAAIPEPARLGMTSLSATQTEPISPPRAVAQEPVRFGIASYNSTETAPVFPSRTAVQEPPHFGMASFATTETEPVSPPRTALPVTPHMGMASVTTSETEPVSPPRAMHDESPVLGLGLFTTADTKPHLPRAFPQEPVLPTDTISSQPVATSTPADPFVVSPITSEQYKSAHAPLPPRRSSRRGDAVSYVDSGTGPEADGEALPGTDSARPGAGFFTIAPPVAAQFPPRASSIRSRSPDASLLAGARGGRQEPTLVFEDDSQPLSQAEKDNNTRTPFAEVSNNAQGQRGASGEDANVKPALKRSKTSEQGTQTMVSSDEIDTMMRNKAKSPLLPVPLPVGENGSRRTSDTSVASERGSAHALRRPSSSGSVRKNSSPQPPLPFGASKKIAMAAQKQPTAGNAPPVQSQPGSMGPPLMPASAYKNQYTASIRSRTPSISKQTPGARTDTTVRARGAPPRPDQSPLTRRSSVSSFASEIDQRFNIPRNGLMFPDDIAPATDPRMIQAITQTMIGEYLWKYTRKAGSSQISGTRHRRFFWVHPYTRTLYWSDQDPSTAGKQQLKAKSVAIESVRVISDDNPSPPGLHRKSIVVVTPGRDIVFTAPTGQRHETWFNALSYLLMRTGAEREQDDGGLTAEDVDEFNPQVQRSASRTTGRTRVSLSSYNSRTTRAASPQRPHHTEVPSLARRDPSPRKGAASPALQDSTPYGSISGKFSSIGQMFKSPGSVRGSFSTRRSKSAQSTRRADGIYDASVVGDSAEDLRAVIERQEREADRLENVRACCDGKHDVGSLSRTGGRAGMMHRHTHAHPAADPMSVSSRPR
ncbi:hypothetical protein MBLNU459_g4975t1 [Dothideomycetes sp. NU459]